MSLIAVANLQSHTDKLALIYSRWLTHIGDHANVLSPVAGTDQYAVSKILNLLVATADDFEQQSDLSTNINAVLQKMDRKSVAQTVLRSLVSDLDSHCQSRGAGVDASITDLSTYLSYYNGGSGAVAYSSMLHPVFGDLYFDMTRIRLPSAGLLQPGIHPLLRAAATNGMGSRAVGSGFVAGTAWESTPLYAEVVPFLEYTADFASGTGLPTFTVAGTDNTGATSTTWTATGAGNNPAAALSTTITPAVTAMARQTVAFASPTGVVVGSVLTVNSGLVDQEVITVETVSGSNITAYFALAHSGGAAVTGYNALALTPGVSGRRLRSVSGITIGITGHASGTVRVIGRQDRSFNAN